MTTVFSLFLFFQVLKSYEYKDIKNTYATCMFIIDFWICQDDFFFLFVKVIETMNHLFHLSHSYSLAKGNSPKTSSLCWVTLTVQSMWEGVDPAPDILTQAEESNLLTFRKLQAERKASIFSLYSPCRISEQQSDSFLSS